MAAEIKKSIEAYEKKKKADNKWSHYQNIIHNCHIIASLGRAWILICGMSEFNNFIVQCPSRQPDPPKNLWDWSQRGRSSFGTARSVTVPKTIQPKMAKMSWGERAAI
jgi:hypothetical protein